MSFRKGKGALHKMHISKIRKYCLVNPSYYVTPMHIVSYISPLTLILIVSIFSFDYTYSRIL